MKADINVVLFSAFLYGSHIQGQGSMLLDSKNTIEVSISGYPQSMYDMKSSFDLTYCVVERDSTTFRTVQKFYI